jgi:hypothetical protein
VRSGFPFHPAQKQEPSERDAIRPSRIPLWRAHPVSRLAEAFEAFEGHETAKMMANEMIVQPFAVDGV